MSDTFDLIFNLSVNLFQGIVFVLFCNMFLSPRFKKGINIVVCCIVVALLFVAITLINYFFDVAGIVELIAFLLIMIPFSVVCHKGKLYLKIIVPMITFALYICVAMIYTTLTSVVFRRDVQQVVDDSAVYRYLYVVIANLTYVFVLYHIYRIYKNRINLKKSTDIIICFIIPLLSLTIAFFATSIIEDAETSDQNKIYLGVVILSVFAIDFSMFSIMKGISKTAELEALNVVMTREQKMYKNEVSNQNAYIEEISLVKHEMKRKISLISELLEHSKIEEAKKFCENTELELKELPGLIKTDNLYFDYIINTAYQKAQNKGIEVHLTIKSSFSDVNGSDLVSIVGNLIDNAFEAMESISGPKHLYITTLQKEHYYILSIKNSISESVLKTNPNLKTTKSDKKSHGHGLKIVNKLLTKYNGTISFSERDQLFDVNLMMERYTNDPKMQKTK